MKIHWNKLESFSFKDLVSITLVLTFVGSVGFVIYSYFLNHDLTLLELVKAQISVIIAILGIYGGSELTASIIPKLQQGKQIIEATNDLLPKDLKKEITPVILDENISNTTPSTPIDNSNLGGV